MLEEDGGASSIPEVGMSGMSKGASLTRVNLTPTTTTLPPSTHTPPTPHVCPPSPTNKLTHAYLLPLPLFVLFNWTDSEKINTISERSLVLGVSLYVLYTALIASQQGADMTHSKISPPSRLIIQKKNRGNRRTNNYNENGSKCTWVA